MQGLIKDSSVTIEQLELQKKKHPALLVYFSHEQCNVCKSLKPKVFSLIKERYPLMAISESDTLRSPELAAQNQVFAAPTLICFFDGKEAFRTGRNTSIEELSKWIERPYNLMFGQ